MLMHPVAFSLIASMSFLGNLGLGRLRARARKFSPAWFVWVHLSVPFILALRIHYQLAPLGIVIPTLIACAIAGQILGARMLLARC